MIKTSALKCGLRISYNDENWWHGNHFKAGNLCDPKPIYYAAIMMKPDWEIIDVGTNVGDALCFWAQRVARVTGFEIASRSYNLCLKNVRQNGLIDKVQLYDIGLSDHSGKVMIVASSAGTSVCAHISSRGKIRRTVATLDAFQLPRVDFLKIDVEGHEPQVLIGAKTTILQHSPILEIEAEENWLKRNDSSLKKLHNSLVEMGYSVFVDHYGQTWNWHEPRTSNVFCGVRDKHFFPRIK